MYVPINAMQFQTEKCIFAPTITKHIYTTIDNRSRDINKLYKLLVHLIRCDIIHFSYTSRALQISSGIFAGFRKLKRACGAPI